MKTFDWTNEHTFPRWVRRLMSLTVPVSLIIYGLFLLTALGLGLCITILKDTFSPAWHNKMWWGE